MKSKNDDLVSMKNHSEEENRIVAERKEKLKKIQEKFGEIYFSCNYPNVVKAWHKHSEMTLNYAVIVGQVKVVLFDDRVGSSSSGCLEEYFLSPENYHLLVVPPGIWNGFKAIGGQMAILANCATIPHRKDEIIRLPHNSDQIGYDWDINHF